jgi:hypothetical protein
MRPDPLIDALGLPTVHGRLVVDEYLSVPGHPEIYACGDAAAVPDLTRPGEITPMTAQHAQRQGATAAHNLAAAYGCSRRRPYKHHDLGLVMDLGGVQAAADVLECRCRQCQPDSSPPPNNHRRQSGIRKVGPMTDVRLVSGTSNPRLAHDVAVRLDAPLIVPEVERFPDGEIRTCVERVQGWGCLRNPVHGPAGARSSCRVAVVAGRVPTRWR